MPAILVIPPKSARPVQEAEGLPDFQDRLLSAMRYQFGGHAEKAAGK
jgi:6-phosphogluconate dehydrogenase (decarboxylating)